MYHDKYFHNNITVSILAYCDNRTDDNTVDYRATYVYVVSIIYDNTVDTTNTKSLSAMQCSGCNFKTVQNHLHPVY